jgi:hypothetical protein
MTKEQKEAMRDMHFCPVCGDNIPDGEKFCSEGCANVYYDEHAIYVEDDGQAPLAVPGNLEDFLCDRKRDLRMNDNEQV